MASISQPKGQELHCTQLPALREIGAAAGADRRRPLHRQLAVSAHPLGVERRHPEELLGLGVVGAEVAGPGDAEALLPVLEHRLGGAEAGAGVDHRGAADDLRHRHRDRRPALGDRQAAVAVEPGDRLEVVARVAVAVVVLAGLEHDHVEAGLGQRRRGDGAAGARADDDHVAFLTLARAARCRRGGPAGSGSDAVGERAADLNADPLLAPRG